MTQHLFVTSVELPSRFYTSCRKVHVMTEINKVAQHLKTNSSPLKKKHKPHEKSVSKEIQCVVYYLFMLYGGKGSMR
jgi:hypothetical protein